MMERKEKLLLLTAVLQAVISVCTVLLPSSFPKSLFSVLLLLSLTTVHCYFVIMYTVGGKVEHVCPLWVLLQ